MKLPCLKQRKTLLQLVYSVIWDTRFSIWKPGFASAGSARVAGWALWLRATGTSDKRPACLAGRRDNRGWRSTPRRVLSVLVQIDPLHSKPVVFIPYSLQGKLLVCLVVLINSQEGRFSGLLSPWDARMPLNKRGYRASALIAS